MTSQTYEEPKLWLKILLLPIAGVIGLAFYIVTSMQWVLTKFHIKIW